MPKGAAFKCVFCRGVTTLASAAAAAAAAATAGDTLTAYESAPGRASPVEGVFFVVSLSCACSRGILDSGALAFLTAASATIIAISDAVAPSVQSGLIKSPVICRRCAVVAFSVRDVMSRARGWRNCRNSLRSRVRVWMTGVYVSRG